jgi:recombination protein U
MEKNSYSNRGKSLEKIINQVNLKYRKAKKAIIYNLPLPVVMTNQGVIPKTTPTDYIGVIGPDGKGVAFDAKETKNKTSFPLKNIHDHQLNFLSLFEEAGGKAFFLIRFTEINPDLGYKVPALFIKDFIKDNDRKSLPIDKIINKEWEIQLTDYLNLYD